MNWKPIETRPMAQEEVSFLVLLPKNDVANSVILQVSIFQGEMYPDHLDGIIDFNDRVTNATHWCELSDADND
jgi:hypothetical protein